MDDAPDGVLLAQQAQAGGEVRVDGLARHQRQRLARHAKHLAPDEAVSLQLEQAVHNLVQRGTDACGAWGGWDVGGVGSEACERACKLQQRGLHARENTNRASMSSPRSTARCWRKVVLEP